MKKTIPLLSALLSLLLCLALLVSCGQENDPNEESESTGYYQLNGCGLSASPLMSRVESEDFDLALLSEDGSLEFRVKHETPERLTELWGWQVIPSAEDFALQMTNVLGLQQAGYQSGNTEAGKPLTDEESGMVYFAYVSGESMYEPENNTYHFFGIRAVEGDGFWVFDGFCKESEAEERGRMFFEWAKGAALSPATK